jgi:hypothetical protein
LQKGFQRGIEEEQRQLAAEQAAKIAAAEARKSPEKSGGGTGKAGLDEDDPVVQAFMSEIRLANAALDARIRQESGVDLNLNINRSSQRGAKVDFSSQAGAGALAAQQAANEAGLAAQEAANKLKQDQERNHLAVMLGLNKEAIDQQMRWQQMTADQRVKVLETTTSESTQILSNFAKSANAETKAGFEAQKALMYSANILSTIQGAAGAFARVMATIPPPASFVIAPIAAASVVASGAAAGKQIRSAKFGGNSKAKAPSTPNFSGGSLGASTGGGGDSFTFNVNVEGQTVFSSVMRANDMASQNGQKSFTTGQ